MNLRALVRLVPLALLAAPALAPAALAAAEPVILLIGPDSERKAETEEDWTGMIPMIEPVFDGMQFCDSPILYGQQMSTEGDVVFQEVCRWVTSNMVVRVDLATGKRTSLGGGNDIRIIRDGPYQGYLLMWRHEYPEGRDGSIDPYYVVTPEGETVLQVPGTVSADGDSAADKWLSENGWHAG